MVKVKTVRRLVCLASTAALLASILLVGGPAAAAGTSNTWHFDSAGDYAYNSEVTSVTNSVAQLKNLPANRFWAKRYLPSGSTACGYTAAAIDPVGNIVVTGNAVFGTSRLLLAKYDKAGTMLPGWPRFSRPDVPNVIPHSIFIDGTGKITVASSSQNLSGGQDFTVWRFDANGHELNGWPKVLNLIPGDNDAAYAAIVDDEGDVVALGSPMTPTEGSIAIMKYRPDGTPVSGWPKTYDFGGNHAYGYDLIQDSDGNYVIAGSGISPAPGQSAMILKYDAQGEPVPGWPVTWDRGTAPPDKEDIFYSISQDGNSQYCLTGTSRDATPTRDVLISRYETDGSLVSGWPVLVDKGPIYPAISPWRGKVDTSGNIATSFDDAPTGSWTTYTLKRTRDGSNFTGFPKAYPGSGGFMSSESLGSDDLDNIYTGGSDQVGANYQAFLVKYPPAARSTGRPFIVNKTGLPYFKLNGFSAKLGSGNQGSVEYQLSPDGNKFYYFDGTRWVEAPDKFSANTAEEVDDNIGSYSSTVGPGTLYVRSFMISNGSQKVSLDSITVDYEAATTWYLAEGSTGVSGQGSFETWVLVQNPGDDDASVKLYYQTPTGEKDGPTLDLKANTRQSVNVGETVPNEWSVSTRIVSNRPVIAERAMYWNTPAAFRQAATDSIGVTTPSTTWYLAEGSTGLGAQGNFETWVLVQNPGDQEANVNLFYQTPAGETGGPNLKLAAHTRQSVNVAETVPNTFSVSTRVTSDQPVIAERAMYWNSPGAVREAATDSIGVSSPSTAWYLAEGSTGTSDSGTFETWVLVQNPGDSDASVTLYYQTAAGEIKGPHFDLKAHTRQTVDVSATVPNMFSVSSRVASNKPVIAERAMYWSTASKYRQAATDSIGATAASTGWYLAEGSTGSNEQGSFETWVLIQNPGDVGTQVVLSFQTTAGETPGPVISLAPHTRVSVNVGDTVQGQWSVSTHVTSDQPVIAERAVYWNTPGVVRQAAHDSIGFDP